MDLAQATGAVETIDLAGEEHACRLLTMKEWGQITAWLKRCNPSPLTRAAQAIEQARESGEPLSAETKNELLEHAQIAALAWPPRLGSTAWFESFDAVDGGPAQMVWQILAKADPAFTLDHAEALVRRFTTADFNEMLRVALYGNPPRLPKAGTATTTTGSTTGPL